MPDGTVRPAEAVPVVKATFVGEDGDSLESNIVQTPVEEQELFKTAGAVRPPFDPAGLVDLYEMSGALRTNIDAYATNIDGFGHTFMPVFDLEDDDAPDKVREALFAVTPEGFDSAEVTDDQVNAKIEEVRKEMLAERMRIEAFFDCVTIEESFTALRARTRVDIESTGNGYWEVLRSRDGNLCQFNYAPAHSIRILPRDDRHTEVSMMVRRTSIHVESDTVKRRFRRYVQVINNQRVVYFKEYGDPRVMSSATGYYYADEQALQRKEKRVRAATELLHFKVHNPRTPYGVPRWISELTSVLGTRHAQEVNLMYFQNRSVPPMAILVSGGRLSQQTSDKLKSYIENEIKGKRNWHKVMILEAEGASSGMPNNNGRVRIEIKPLTNAQQSDAQFLQYIEKNVDMIGSVFRLPRLLRGDARDFNRSTAQTSVEFTEQQVFQPLRKEFDFIMNRAILTELGIKFWKFRSKGPEFADPVDQMKTINDTAKAGYLTAGELRELAAHALNRDFKGIAADWTEQPLQLTLAGMAMQDTDGVGAEPGRGGDNPLNPLESQAKNLVQLRDLFQARADMQARREYMKQHEEVNGGDGDA